MAPSNNWENELEELWQQVVGKESRTMAPSNDTVAEPLPLDAVCARYAFATVTKDQAKAFENVLTKALGVLQEDGVFAYFLHLASTKEGAREAKRVSDQTYALLRDAAVGLDLAEANTVSQRLEALLPLAESLDDLLFARDLLERTLIYARYKAKAEKGEQT